MLDSNTLTTSMSNCDLPRPKRLILRDGGTPTQIILDSSGRGYFFLEKRSGRVREALRAENSSRSSRHLTGRGNARQKPLRGVLSSNTVTQPTFPLTLF